MKKKKSSFAGLDRCGIKEGMTVPPIWLWKRSLRFERMVVPIRCAGPSLRIGSAETHTLVFIVALVSLLPCADEAFLCWRGKWKLRGRIVGSQRWYKSSKRRWKSSNSFCMCSLISADIERQKSDSVYRFALRLWLSFRRMFLGSLSGSQRVGMREGSKDGR